MLVAAALGGGEGVVGAMMGVSNGMAETVSSLLVTTTMAVEVRVTTAISVLVVG